MPAGRVSIRRVREILYLKHEGRPSDREIARSLRVARSTADLTLERVAAGGLRWPLPTPLRPIVCLRQCYMPTEALTGCAAQGGAPGKAGCRRRCARLIRPANGCSSTTPVRRLT